MLTKQIAKLMNKGILLSLLAFLLAGCQGLPDGLVNYAKALPARIDAQEALYHQSKQDFAKLSEHIEWPFIKPYTEKEDWQLELDKAGASLKALRSLYVNSIEPMLDDGDKKNADVFRGLLENAQAHLAEIGVHSQHHQVRIVNLLHTRDTAPAMYKDATGKVGEIATLSQGLTKKVRPLAKKYPHKSTDLAAREQKLKDMRQDSSTAFSVIAKEHKNIARGMVDYAAYFDNYQIVKAAHTNSQNYSAVTHKKIDELSKSYTKILNDQRIEYYIVIGRSSWCEMDNCYGEDTMNSSPILVDETVFEYFETQDGNIAKRTSGWGRVSFKLLVDQNKWNALRLDPNWNWPRGDSSAVYWVENAFTRTYHKYTEVLDNKTTESDWVQIDEDAFWKNHKNMGMAVLSKPYGYYEEDALTKAQPAGMAFIAQPNMVNGAPTGSNQYGEWRQQNGKSFWHYYGQYRFFSALLGPSRYYYDDWYGYSRHRGANPYYGRNNDYGTYGRTTYSNKRYRNSDYAQRNPDTVSSAASGKGSTGRAGGSIRSAGGSARTRGPGSGK